MRRVDREFYTFILKHNATQPRSHHQTPLPLSVNPSILPPRMTRYQLWIYKPALSANKHISLPLSHFQIQCITCINYPTVWLLMNSFTGNRAILCAGAVLKPLCLSKQLTLCSQQHIDQLFPGYISVNCLQTMFFRNMESLFRTTWVP